MTQPVLLRRMAAAACGWGLAASAMAQTIWVAPWSGLQAPPASSTWTGNGQFSPDGELVVGVDRGDDTQLLRAAATGSLRWTRSIANFGLVPTSIATQSDGSALFAAGDGYVGKVASDGALAWLSAQPSLDNAIVAVAPDRALAAACLAGTPSRLVLELIDSGSGAGVWQRDLPVGATSCAAPELIGDGQGGAFVAGGARLVRVTASGDMVWSVASGGGVFGVGADVLYVGAGSALQALHVADGSLAWSRAGAINSMLPSRPSRWLIVEGELIANLAGQLQRFDAATGAARWSVPLDGSAAVAPALIDGVVAVASSVGGVTVLRLDPASGTILGSTPVADDSTYRNVIAVGAFGAATIGVLAGSSPAGLQVYRVDAASGTAVASVPLPATPSAVSSAGTIDGGADLVGAGTVRRPDGIGTVVRSVRADTGAVLWQTDALVPVWSAFPPQLALGSDLAVVSLASGGPDGFASVQALDRATGSARWTTSLWTPGQRDAYLSAPVLDAQGDAYLALGVNDDCPSPSSSSLCMRQSILRLAASDGHIVWQRDVTAPWAPPQPLPYPFSLVGDDVVVVGDFDDAPDPSRIVGLARSSGNPQWRSAPLATDGAYALQTVDSTHVLARHAQQQSLVSTGSGTVEWSIAQPACAHPCFEYDSITLPNGDRLAVGESGGAAWITRLRRDGSAFDTWRQTLPSAEMGSFIPSIKTDDSGRVWLSLVQRWRRESGGLRALAQFDPVTMRLVGQQVVSGRMMDAFASFSAGTIDRVGSGEAWFGSWIRSDDRTGSAESRLDTRVSADGDLAVSVAVDRPSAGPGALVSATIHIAYSGTAAVAGAQLDASFPAHQGLDAVACTGQGVSECTTDVRSSNLHASFALQPGAAADITVQFRPLANSENLYSGVRASVRGPLGLRESDMLNNMALETVVIGLFADGFD